MATTPARPVDTTDRRIELYVRSLTSRTRDGVVERVVEGLRRRRSAGAIDSFTVRIWGERVGLSTTAVDTDRGQDVLERIATFRRWASRNRVSLAPFFESTQTTSRVTGEAYTTLRLPVIAMAEYRGTEVVLVSPHEGTDGVCTVEDHLDRLGDRPGAAADAT